MKSVTKIFEGGKTYCTPSFNLPTGAIGADMVDSDFKEDALKSS